MSWNDYLIKAENCQSDMGLYLSKAVRQFMKEKGFEGQILEMFDMDFASGTETIIKFNNDGEMADLDILTASQMTKEEIIEKLSQYMTKNSIKLLKGEQL